MKIISKILAILFSLSPFINAEVPDYGPYGPKALRYSPYILHMRKALEQPPLPQEGDMTSLASKSQIEECVENDDKVCLINLYPVTERDIELALAVNVMGEPRVYPDEEIENGVKICVDKVESIDQQMPSLSLLSGKLDALPGQLVTLKSLRKGSPALIALKRKPITLLIDLPGAMASEKIRVEDPNNGSEIYAAIDKALSSFYDRIEKAAQEQGAEVPGNVGGYTITHVESSNDTLAKMQLGFSAQDKISGMKGRVDVNAVTKTTTRVMYTKFQQTIFQVVADSVPVEDLFADSVTAAQLYQILREPSTDKCTEGSDDNTAEKPEKLETPCMVKRAMLGRVMLLTSTFRNVATTIDLNAVMNYALAGKSVDVDTENQYRSALQNAEFSLTVVGSTQIPIIQDHTKLMEKINETMALSRNSPPALLEVTFVTAQKGLAAKVSYSGDAITTTCTQYQSGFVDFRSTDWKVTNTQQLVEWNLKDLTTGKLLLDDKGAPIVKQYRQKLAGSGKAPAADLPVNAVNVHVKVLNCGLGKCDNVIWENKYPSGSPNICLKIESYGFLGLKSRVHSVTSGRCN